jgi:prephenate dehydrogenase
MPLVHLVLTSMNSQSPAVDQAVRRFAAGGFQDITERLAGDAHFFRGFFMIQAFEVR